MTERVTHRKKTKIRICEDCKREDILMYFISPYCANCCYARYKEKMKEKNKLTPSININVIPYNKNDEEYYLLQRGFTCADPEWFKGWEKHIDKKLDFSKAFQ